MIDAEVKPQCGLSIRTEQADLNPTVIMFILPYKERFSMCDSCGALMARVCNSTLYSVQADILIVTNLTLSDTMYDQSGSVRVSLAAAAWI